MGPKVPGLKRPWAQVRWAKVIFWPKGDGPKHDLVQKVRGPSVKGTNEIGQTAKGPIVICPN